MAAIAASSRMRAATVSPSAGSPTALKPRSRPAWHHRRRPTTEERAMRIWSESFEHRGRIPAEFALGAPDGFGGNRSPHLAWDEAPAGTRSFALLCIDADAPTDASLAGRDDIEIPVEHPRGEFVHWAVVDIAADVRDIA